MYAMNMKATIYYRGGPYVVILNGPAANDLERVEALITFLQTSLGPRQLHRRIRCYRQGPRGGWREVRP